MLLPLVEAGPDSASQPPSAASSLRQGGKRGSLGSFSSSFIGLSSLRGIAQACPCNPAWGSSVSAAAAAAALTLSMDAKDEPVPCCVEEAWVAQWLQLMEASTKRHRLGPGLRSSLPKFGSHAGAISMQSTSATMAQEGDGPRDADERIVNGWQGSRWSPAYSAGVTPEPDSIWLAPFCYGSCRKGTITRVRTDSLK